MIASGVPYSQFLQCELLALVVDHRDSHWGVGCVVTAIGLLGADLALLVLGLQGLAGAEAEIVCPGMHLIAAWLLRPLTLLALGTGLMAVRRSGDEVRPGWSSSSG